MRTQPSSPTLVVLAAGASTRYGRPKQLEPVGPGGEALLDYALFDGAREGCVRAALVIQADKQGQFADHLRLATAANLDIHFALQTMDLPDLPEETPSGRTKPWGTGFAVLAAREHLDGPFAVCNADDFYGRDALAGVAIALKAMAENPSPRPTPLPAVTVGYRLDATLSDSGGVSRGICHVGDDGTLLSLTEGLDLRRVGLRVQGHDPAGAPLEASPETPVCMGLWGFHPGILDLLAERFTTFLKTDPGPDQEFYLTEAVNDLVAAGKVRCTVLPTDEKWLGVTFLGDRDAVAASLRKLVESGVYPEDLWAENLWAKP